MADTFNNDKFLGIVGDLKEPATVFDGNDPVLGPMQDQNGRRYTGQTFPRQHLVLHQKIYRQPGVLGRSHIDERGVGRFQHEQSGICSLCRDRSCNARTQTFAMNNDLGAAVGQPVKMLQCVCNKRRFTGTAFTSRVAPVTRRIKAVAAVQYLLEPLPAR